MIELQDRLRRPLSDLRISVTDRCNLRCSYCMPRDVFGPGFEFLPRSELLSFEEIGRIVRVASSLGVRKVRLTGGEPLLRRDLPRLVELLRRVDGIEDIALTTNGWLLKRHAQSLADAGLSRVTVSLDSLDARVLADLGGGTQGPERVLAGIEAAAAAGLVPLKVNMVVRRGANDGCVTAMAARFRNSGHVLRFIEYMDVGSTNGWDEGEVVPAVEIVAELGARWPLTPLPPTRDGEVATRYRYLDGGGEIGVIPSISEPFCGGCTRARLSADGKLFTCLFAREGADIRSLLRSNADDVALVRRLSDVWGARADRYSAERASLRARERERTQAGQPAAPKLEMSYIGG